MTLNDEEWKMLSDFFTANFGLVFEAGRRGFLENRLTPRVQALHLSTFAEYYRYLVRHPERAAEIRELKRTITNNETYFFREPHQLDILGDHVLQDLKPGRPDRRLRLLSAGCSSGDEVYSMVISLQQAGADTAGWEWQVDGCDLNPQKIAQARAAVYEPMSLRACDEATRALYFTETDKHFVLKPRHRKGTRFFETNLLAPELDATPYDVIFCRNVLIYFSEMAFHNAISHFFALLADDGYLMLGHSESLIGRREDFEPVRVKDSIVYRKKRAA